MEKYDNSDVPYHDDYNSNSNNSSIWRKRRIWSKSCNNYQIDYGWNYHHMQELIWVHNINELYSKLHRENQHNNSGISIGI